MFLSIVCYTVSSKLESNIGFKTLLVAPCSDKMKRIPPFLTDCPIGALRIFYSARFKIPVDSKRRHLSLFHCRISEMLGSTGVRVPLLALTHQLCNCVQKSSDLVKSANMTSHLVMIVYS